MGGGSMRRFLQLTILLLLLGAGALPWRNAASYTLLAERRISADDDAEAGLVRQFNQTVRPFLATYCTGCHSGSEPAAGFDLQRYATLASVVEDFGHWAIMQRKLAARKMPPSGTKQPPEALRRQVIEWITAARRHEARKHQGDPGPAPARRLSNPEYNYTVRDLTGVDLRPAREFPIDPANQAGFDNSGEALAISPALMAKYLDAARRIADHMVLRPEGFVFAPHPMVAESDREKYPIRR